jgi:hypothetical protein
MSDRSFYDDDFLDNQELDDDGDLFDEFLGGEDEDDELDDILGIDGEFEDEGFDFNPDWEDEFEGDDTIIFGEGDD